MNTQERELLSGFLQQLQQANANPKDPDAEALIQEGLSRQPDAGYLLVQRALGLNLALSAAQAEIAKLQTQQAPTSAGASFLGNQTSWGRSGAASTSPGPQLPRAAAGPAAAGAQPSTWGSGMLTNIATTAAGVVAGSFLYQGMQNMMGHHKTDPMAANDKGSGSLSDDEIADTLDADDSVAAGDGGSDSSDIG